MTESDPRAWMWNEALAMIARAEHLRRQFFEPGIALQAVIWEPPVDIFETDRELWIIVALPGVEHDDLDVSIEADGLRVTGQRRLPAAARTASIHRLEIPRGRFERHISLPSARYVLGRSDLVNGCLVVNLTKHN
ncbi:MAG TPA: Hsp20/alpha crystallin family protein [Steroidobacteraceae bacterium]|jgi:HSP20 family molecular chaperone IbpA